MEHSAEKGKWRLLSHWLPRACCIPKRSMDEGSALAMAAAASVQWGQGNVLWRMFRSKVLQSEVCSKNQCKTSIIAIPMELKVGLGRQGGAQRRRARAATGCGFASQPLPAAWCPASPEPSATSAGRAGRFPTGFPEFASFACWKSSMKKDV